MQNDSLLNARQASNHAGRTGDKYQVINGFKTRVLTDEDKTRVFFHDTPVVSFNGKSIELNTGGWQTRSTKVRMNQASQEFGLGYRVFQKKGDWYVDYLGKKLAYSTNKLTLDRSSGRLKGGE